MKKTSLLLLIIAAALVCVWLLWKPEPPTSTGVALPKSPAVSASQNTPFIPVRPIYAPSDDTASGGNSSTLSHQAWIESRSASIVISQTIDPIIKEPLGTICLGDASGSLGETPPVYRLQLKTAKNPILIGDKDTRHNDIRRVSSVYMEGNSLFLKPEIYVSYSRSASMGGFVFNKNEDQITQIGLIIPEVKVPEGNDPSSSRWTTYIRIDDRGITVEELAKTVTQPLGADTVLVLPTQQGPAPATARVLWFTLDANGSFVVSSK